MAAYRSDQSDVVFEGNLYYHPKRKILKNKKEYYTILFKRSAMGHARLELFENKKDVTKGSHALMVVCSDVMKVQKIPDLNDEDNTTVVLSMKDQQQHTFSAKNYLLCDHWLKALQDTIFQPTDVNYNVQKPSEQVTDINDIYLPAEEVRREFTVAVDSATRKKLKADGQLRLLVENGHITLISMDNNRITRFGIEHLRRLGYSDDNFHIEAGRKSECGEGDYIFLTKMGKNIHTLVNREKDNWRRQTNGQTRGPSLPPGQVLLPNLPPEESSSTLRNHEYEDVSQWRNFSDPKSRVSQTLQQPPPLSTITSTGTKSQPTAARGGARSLNHGNQQPSLELQMQLANNFKKYPDEANIYDEACIPSEAWKSYGRDEEDDEDPSVKSPEDNTYDNLTHFNRSIAKAQESPYDMGAASGRPDAEGAYMEAARNLDKKGQPKANTQEPQECIYSQVNFSKKLKNRK